MHPDRQRAFHLVRHHCRQEPAELPRSAAGRPHGLCDQCRSTGLHAWPDAGHPTVALLAAHTDTHFADRTTWQAHLVRFGVAERRHGAGGELQAAQDPMRLATEAALWGSVRAHGFLSEAVILSDDAGPFDVGPFDVGPFDVGGHALCSVHAERLVHKLDSFTDLHRAAQGHVRGLIWWFYRDLKAYRADPTPRRRRELRRRFDRIFCRRTGFATLDRLLARLHANKSELLMVLDRPEVPLHTNGSENDIRCQVTKRKVSGGTRSDRGRDCRDTFLGLAKTCQKLKIAFWDYLGSRLNVPNAQTIPFLPAIVARRCIAQP